MDNSSNMKNISHEDPYVSNFLKAFKQVELSNFYQKENSKNIDNETSEDNI